MEVMRYYDCDSSEAKTYMRMKMKMKITYQKLEVPHKRYSLFIVLFLFFFST